MTQQKDREQIRSIKNEVKLKISVITLHNIKNYGSALQAYATQKKLEQIGVQVELVDYWRKDVLDKNLLKECIISSDWNKNFFSRLIYKLIKYPSVHKRIQIFNDFLKLYINLTPVKYISSDELVKNPPIADIYCTGSDQVWNSYWNRGIEEPYFLNYIPKGKKCFAYAASFGKERLTQKEQNIIKPLLQKYSAISMREASGVRILKEMGLSSVQILDPTLVLESSEWKKLMAGRTIRRRYLLIYQLNKNYEFDHYAQQLARNTGLKLIRLSYDYHHILKTGHLVCCPTVEKWLSLFYYADYILTDSFHGTAFSINFNKQFSVFYPPKFCGRLKSILELTGLENRVVTDINNFSQYNKKIDYKPVNKILAYERQKADSFLRSVLFPRNSNRGNS
jgi:hypothetical protein